MERIFHSQDYNIATPKVLAEISLLPWQNIRTNVRTYLQQFALGCTFTYNLYKQRGLHISLPFLSIYKGKGNKLICFNTDQEEISVNFESFVFDAYEDNGYYREFNGKEAGLFPPLIATVPDAYLLKGVEEMHHAIYFEYKGYVITQTKLNFTEYMSQQHEFAALKTCYRIAKLQNLPISTISSLRTQIEFLRNRCL